MLTHELANANELTQLHLPEDNAIALSLQLISHSHASEACCPRHVSGLS
jgi:hypothetical protein